MALDVRGEPTHVPPERMQVARVSIGMKDEVAREMARRKLAKEFRSCVMDPADPFHDLMEPAPFKVFYGGRDARKSWSFAEALIRQTNEKKLRVLCTRRFQNSIADSAHRLLSDMIYRLGLDHRFDVNKGDITNPYTGSEFIFKGLQRPNELKSIEGVDICVVWEAQDIEDGSWEVLDPTIRKEGSEMWIEFNVTSEDAPTYHRWVTHAPPGTKKHLVNYDSNTFLSTVSRRKIDALKARDHDAYLHIYMGVPRKLSDALIFKHWVVEPFDDEVLFAECIRQGGRAFYGMDHGFAHDPYALIRYFILDEVLYISHEAFGWKTEFAGQMAPPLPGGYGERGELEQLLDTVPGVREWPIKADSSRPETISFLANKAFNISAAEKWEGCVEDGIAHIQGFRKVVIHTRCKEMAQEARMYRFKVDPKQIDPRTGAPMILPVVVDAWNHGWDAVRYGLDGHIQRGGDLGTWAALGKGYGVG